MKDIERRYYTNGNIKEEIYYINLKPHKEDGPAIIRYYENGNIIEKMYCIDGEFHREDGPAIVRYNEDGIIKEERFFKNGNYHREDGPAIVGYINPINANSYFINGRKIEIKDCEIQKEEILEENKMFNLYEYKFSLFQNPQENNCELFNLINSKLIAIKMTE